MIRRLSILLTMLTLLAACGGQPTAAPPTAPVADATTVPAATSAAPTTAAPTIAAPAATRAITHAMGETQVPVAPQRIASLSPIVTDNLIALGVTPTVITTFNGQDFTDYEYLAQELQGLTIVGKLAEPNLEQLAQARPDLIIGRVNDHEKIYNQLAQIAPTVLLEDQGGDLRAWLERTAEVVGATDAATRYAAYEQRAAAAGEQVRQTIGEQSVAFVRFAPDNIRLYGDERLGSKIMYADMGLAMPALVQELATGENFVEVSLEQLAELDADHIFLLDQSKDTSPADSAVWRALPAVQADRVYPASRDIWINLGIIASERVVESVQQALMGGSRSASSTATALQIIETTSEYRLIKDALGEKRVPLNPTCIVAAGSGYLDHLLALGVKPCGGAHGPGGSGFPEHLANQLDGVEYVGGTLEINLETVARLNPDLIIAMHPAHTEGEFKTLLDPIATTVYLTEPWADWRASLREIGRMLGKEQLANERIAAFEQRMADVKATVAPATVGKKVMFLRIFPEKLRVYGVGSPTGDVLYNGLGLTPATLTSREEHATEISLEQLPEIDADILFVFDQTKDQMSALKANPLWQRIPAVQANRVYAVDVKTWVQGEGVFAYEMIIDDVVQVTGR